jgi:hypothetical protein
LFSEFPEISFKMLNSRRTCNISDNEYFQVCSSFYVPYSTDVRVYYLSNRISQLDGIHSVPFLI